MRRFAIMNRLLHRANTASARPDAPSQPDSPTGARRLLSAVLIAFGLCAFPMSAAEAAPTCLKTDNQCDPNKLCTFKNELAGKVFLYQTLLRNSQITRNSPGHKREGIRYDGTLYDEAVAEAVAAYPKESKQVQ